MNKQIKQIIVAFVITLSFSAVANAGYYSHYVPEICDVYNRYGFVIGWEYC